MFVENIPVMTRQEARNKNLKKYFTGTPCKWGHLSPKTTAQSRCATCAAQSGDKEKRSRWVMREDYAPSGVLDVGDWVKEHGLFKVAKDRYKTLVARTKDDLKGYFKGYENVTLCDEWKKFQPFFEWYVENIVNDTDFIDKDLLQRFVKNKVYSPETCVMVPREVNSALSMGIKGDVFTDKKYMGSYTRKTYSSVKGKGDTVDYVATFTFKGNDNPTWLGSFKDEYSAHDRWRTEKIKRIDHLVDTYKEEYSFMASKLKEFSDEMKDDQKNGEPTFWDHW